MSSCFTIYVAESVLFKVDGKIVWEETGEFIYKKLCEFAQKYGCKIKVFCLYNSDEEKQLKREWCKNVLHLKSNDIDIIKKHENKFCHADPLSLLIDTNEANVNTFIYAGGHALLFSNHMGQEIFNGGKVTYFIWSRFFDFFKLIERDDKIDKLDDASKLLETELRYLFSHTNMKLYDWQYAYNYCLDTIFTETEKFYAAKSDNFKKGNAELPEKYKSILSFYDESSKIKRYDNTSEFDSVSFLESYPLIQENTNGHGKNVFEQTVYHFKKHHKINLFDLPETECKAILFYVFANMFTYGILLGKNRELARLK